MIYVMRRTFRSSASKGNDAKDERRRNEEYTRFPSETNVRLIFFLLIALGAL